MALEFTEEQLNNFDKGTLIQLFLAQQKQLAELDKKMQLLIEQVAVLNNKRFGKSSEKMEPIPNQMMFVEVDGEIVFFNEAEAVYALDQSNAEEEIIRTRAKKKKGKRDDDLKDLPVIPVMHTIPDEELINKFGENGWYQLEDEVYNRYRFTPAKVEVEEHHVGVYKSKKDGQYFVQSDISQYYMIIYIMRYINIM